MSLLNQFKTVLLLGLLTALLLWIGSFWGSSGLTVMLILSIIINIGSFFYGHKMILRMYKAKQVTSDSNHRLYNIVKEVAKETGIPMPKVYIVPSPQSNAFATGPSYKKACIACNQGLLDTLDDEELKGVVAHEAAHIKNRDTLIQTVAATIAGVISYVAFMARWGALFGGFGRDRDSGNMIELLVLAILTPLIATLIQLAISRSREFVADATAAKSLKSGKGLASALKKIHANIHDYPLRPGAATETTAHMMIANPFRSKGLVKFFSTHPPVEQRIKRLQTTSFS
ncbi:MAG: zinc metalloprotease HtpX [Candidatus Woesearchaeota archaeon]|jgi:heat shock protein HtpX|nr:zinc metalloprotease HtpX [Candidatus Woesearchaeota archaeon]MDP7324344.1 zinc metalloprotease HtpX [Candidatus Woesearchaeota archaeon]MDP7457936.1 zinc metalloprotease HtpX [Candidatus Woesearchaeota archaeon]